MSLQSRTNYTWVQINMVSQATLWNHLDVVGEGTRTARRNSIWLVRTPNTNMFWPNLKGHVEVWCSIFKIHLCVLEIVLIGQHMNKHDIKSWSQVLTCTCSSHSNCCLRWQVWHQNPFRFIDLISWNDFMTNKFKARVQLWANSRTTCDPFHLKNVA